MSVIDPMKVLYDCTTLIQWEGHATGIQRVVEELGRELIHCMPEAQLVVFDAQGSCHRYSLESRAIGTTIALGRGDLIFCAGHDWDYLDHFAIIQEHVAHGVRLGILYYDIIPLKFSFTYSREFVTRFEFWLRNTLQTVDVALAISACTANDVISYASHENLRQPDIRVLRLGDHLPGELRSQVPSAAIVEMPRLPYILSVGTIEYRKNHAVLLNAYRYLIEDIGFTPPKLYIVGKQGMLDGGIREQVAGDIRLKGLVEVVHGLTDGDLQALYQSALFTVYPSIYEGWGLPVAESLYFGKPCITSNSSSMKEIAPKFTRFAHPLLVQEWAQHIHQLASRPDVLAMESLRVAEGYTRMSWKDAANRFVDLLEIAF